MKITLSKQQWQQIGKQTGWIKSSNLIKNASLYVEDELDQEINDNQLELTLLVSDEYNSYKVKTIMQFNFEPAQNGGRNEPSWDSYYSYSGCNVVSIEGIDTNNTETENLKNKIKDCVELYCKNESETFERKMLDNLKEEINSRKLERSLSNKRY